MKRKPFETWAVVEIVGHKQIAGRCTEEPIAGVNMLRVDVPGCGEWPPHTKYFGGGSIYAIHPCAQEIACKTAEELASRWGYTPMPVSVPELSRASEIIRQAKALIEQRALPAGAVGADDADDDDGNSFDYEGLVDGR